MKRALVDTVASVLFFTCIATVSERWIAGLDWPQVIASRLAATPAMIATGRPYGLWRDWLMHRSGARGQLGRGVVDTLAFLSFQVPVYAAILWWVGAAPAQMVAALGSAIVLMLAISRPFGLFLDVVRRAFGVDRPRI